MNVRDELRVLVYELDKDHYGHPITLEWRGDGTWAICHLGSVYSRNHEWEYEPNPSSRSDEFIARTRYSSPEEAVEHWRRI